MTSTYILSSWLVLHDLTGKDRSEIKKDVDFPEAGEDTALCDKETKPPRIAQGSSNVFINNQPAARKGDKLECSAAIVGGSPDVFIGGEQVTYLDIQPEFPRGRE